MLILRTISLAAEENPVKKKKRHELLSDVGKSMVACQESFAQLEEDSEIRAYHELYMRHSKIIFSVARDIQKEMRKKERE